jgi:hypothetical protein
VYGNLLIEREGSGNRQMVHYGGDNGNTDTYRHGVLHFYNNTLWSDRTDRNTLVRLSSARDTADIRNNVLHTKAAGSSLEILAGEGVALLGGNWLPAGWNKSFDLVGTVTESGTNAKGADPGFADLAAEDFRIAAGAPSRRIAGPLSADATTQSPALALVDASPLAWTERTDLGIAGAFAPVEKTGVVPVVPGSRKEGARATLVPAIDVRFGMRSRFFDAIGRSAPASR